MMMFGLTVVGAVALTVLSGRRCGRRIVIAGTAVGDLTSVGAEWTAFYRLLLGWLAAMWGASSGVKQEVVTS